MAYRSRRTVGWLVAVLGLCPVQAEEAMWPLRYKFTAGETLTYETRTTCGGRIRLEAGDKQRAVPLATDAVERVTYRVSQVKDDGSAWIAARLQHLHVTSSGLGGGGVFEVTETGDGVRVQSDNRSWSLPAGGDYQAAEAVPILGTFTTRDAAQLTLPVKLLVTPAGHVLKQQGQTWSARLAGVAVLGTLTPLLQPFGSGLPELPGKPLPTGQEWVQDRAAPLPGSTETYPLRVTFTVGGRETIGPYDTVRIEFDCRTNLADRAFRFDGLPGVTLPLTVESLSHQFHGRSALDAERGRLVEQHLVSQFVSTSVGQTDRAFTLNSEVKIESTMLLLAVEAGPAAE